MDKPSADAIAIAAATLAAEFQRQSVGPNSSEPQHADFVSAYRAFVSMLSVPGK